MRQGFNPRLVFDDHGRLVAIATGSDACTEHEGGSKALQAALCEQPASDTAVIEALKRNEPVEYPNLLETKRITKFPKGLQFVRMPGPEPEALFGYAPSPLPSYLNELGFPFSARKEVDVNVAGAWDEGSFAIRARTARYVAALERFYAAVLDGKVLFSGLFLCERLPDLAGVILAHSERLTAADRETAKRAQEAYESKLRLKARDESREIMQEILRRMGSRTHIGFLWPVWADRMESEVLYGFNPSRGVKAGYFGPYRKEDLLAWADAKGSYELPPARRTQSEVRA